MMPKPMEGIDTSHAPPPHAPPVRVGVIGLGTVGATTAQLCRQRGFEVRGFDTQPAALDAASASGLVRVATAAEVVDAATSVVLVCVPTPPAPVGGHDTTAVQAACAALSQARCLCPVLVMSTVCPGTTASFAAMHPSLRLFHCPEFLSSATKEYDMLHCSRAILGVTPGMPAAMTDRACVFLRRLHPGAADSVSVVKASESEATKLFCNVFYALKVRAFTSFYAACGAMSHSASGAASAGACDTPNYDVVRQLMVGQGWIHPMHTYVPGADGAIGVHGACLPKDCMAAISWLGVAPEGTLSKELAYLKAILQLSV